MVFFLCCTDDTRFSIWIICLVQIHIIHCWLLHATNQHQPPMGNHVHFMNKEKVRVWGRNERKICLKMIFFCWISRLVNWKMKRCGRIVIVDKRAVEFMLDERAYQHKMPKNKLGSPEKISFEPQTRHLLSRIIYWIKFVFSKKKSGNNWESLINTHFKCVTVLGSRRLEAHFCFNFSAQLLLETKWIGWGGKSVALKILIGLGYIVLINVSYYEVLLGITADKQTTFWDWIFRWKSEGI